jgi:hypothetical protein
VVFTDSFTIGLGSDIHVEALTHLGFQIRRRTRRF